MAEDPLSAQAHIGYLPEGAPSYEDMTPAAFLRFIARIRGFKGEEASRAVARAMDRAQLVSVAGQRIDTLSKGFRRRVGLAQAILHDPDVLILDEPTDGLDPNQKFAVRRLVRAMAEKKAILISTHILEEVEALCTRVLVIDKGAVVADSAPTALLEKSKLRNTVTVEVAAPDADNARMALALLDGRATRTETARNGEVVFTLTPRDGGSIVGPASETLSAASVPMRGIYAERGRLDDVFRALTSSDAPGDAA